jgi:hypothetical protein
VVKEAIEAMRVMRAKPRALAAGRGVGLGVAGAVNHVTADAFAALMPSDSQDPQTADSQGLKNVFLRENPGTHTRMDWKKHLRQKFP